MYDLNDSDYALISLAQNTIQMIMMMKITITRLELLFDAKAGKYMLE